MSFLTRAVVLAQLAGEHLEALDHQRQLVGLVHRAGDVHQEHEIRLGPLVAIHFAALDADPHEAMIGLPWATGDFDVCRERGIVGGTPGGAGGCRRFRGGCGCSGFVSPRLCRGLCR